MIVITAGQKYNDIDALACAVAYKNLCDLQNRPAKIVLPGPLNESVTEEIKAWDFTIEKELTGNPKSYNYVLVDVSEPGHFASFVQEDKVIEIYDHRHGFGDYWQKKLGDKARIQLIGACATLIWEEFVKANLADKISPVSANLLATAILSNTLNLQAQITSPRDKQALAKLANRITLPSNWREQYFDQVSRGIMDDPLGSMTNDTKTLGINGKQYIITQLELWNAEDFVNKNYDLIVKVLAERDIPYTFLTCPSISEGFNYLVAINDDMKAILTTVLDAEFDVNIGKTKKLWLRKEIMRLLL